MRKRKIFSELTELGKILQRGKLQPDTLQNGQGFGHLGELTCWCKMDLQEYIRDHFSGKRIILVGNARSAENQSIFIDNHDLVVRFNLFNAGLTGEKIDVWCVNLNIGNRQKRRKRDQHCETIQNLNQQVLLITPYEEDREKKYRKRLCNAREYYRGHGLNLIFPDQQLSAPLSKQPSCGFYMAHRLVSEGIHISVIGFTGETTNKHDGTEESRLLRQHERINFIKAP